MSLMLARDLRKLCSIYLYLLSGKHEAQSIRLKEETRREDLGKSFPES